MEEYVFTLHSHSTTYLRHYFVQFPTTSNLGEAVEPDNNHLKTRLLYFVKREYITDLLPDIIKDIKGEISTWGNSGNIDLFENIYSVSCIDTSFIAVGLTCYIQFVFKLTCRLLVCKELADNDKLRKHVRGLYWNIEDAANSLYVSLNLLESHLLA